MGRVMIGLVAGAGLMAWSERFRNGGLAIFSYSLKVVGSGTLYFSLWAAFRSITLFRRRGICGHDSGTAFNGYMAWVQDAELLALYAIVGGLSTPAAAVDGREPRSHPVQLSAGAGHCGAGAGGAASLVAAALCAPFGTVLIFTGWWTEYYSDAQFGRTVFFLTCFFLIFAFGAEAGSGGSGRRRASLAWDNLALTFLPMANAALGFLAYYAFFDWFKSDWAGAWLAVGFAAFYLLLLRLPAQGWLQASPPLLSSLHLTAAVVFLTIAIPLKAQGRWLTIGWLVEGAALLWVASRQRLRCCAHWRCCAWRLD